MTSTDPRGRYGTDHDVHGRFTAMPGIPDHGTRARYVSRNWPCRCDSCKDAHAAYYRARRARKGQ